MTGGAEQRQGTGKGVDAENAGMTAGDSITAHAGGDLAGRDLIKIRTALMLGKNVIDADALSLALGHDAGALAEKLEKAPAITRRQNLPPLPRRPSLIGRRQEIGQAIDAIHTANPLQFYGPMGIGKTWLLQYLCHEQRASQPDGIVYISARNKGLQDVFQIIFDAFFETETGRPYHPSDVKLRDYFSDHQAAIILDDLDLSREDIQSVLNLATQSAIVWACQMQRHVGTGQTVKLRGLQIEDAVTLIEHTLGQTLTGDDLTAGRRLAEALKGKPLSLIQIVGKAFSDDIPLGQLVDRIIMVLEGELTNILSDDQQHLIENIAVLERELATTLDDDQWHLIEAIAVLAGTGVVGREHVGPVAAVVTERVQPLLKALERRGLALTHSPRYGVPEEVVEYLQRNRKLTDVRERALNYWVSWSAAHQKQPETLLTELDALMGALEWAVATRRTEAVYLARLLETPIALAGRWDTWRRILELALSAANATEDTATRAWALHQLGSRALAMGDTAIARNLLARAYQLRRSLNDELATAITEHNLSLIQEAHVTGEVLSGKVSEKTEASKLRVGEEARPAKRAVVESSLGIDDAVSGTASPESVAPSSPQVRQQARWTAGLAKENPLGLAIGAAAIGFLAGLAVPSTRVEDEKLGPVADQVKDKVKETGQEALDRGKQVAQEVASTATDTAKQSAQEHGQELAESAKQSAQEVGSETRQSTSYR